MIKGVVFDLDHTLFDRYGTIRAIMPDFVKVFDVSDDLTLEQLTDIFIYADKHINNYGWRTVLGYMTERGVFNTPPEFEDYRSFLVSHFKNTAVEYPFAKPMLKKLKEDGYKVGLITNGNFDIQDSKLRLLGLYEYFDEVIISRVFGVDKPGRGIFDEMAKRLGLKASEMLYVGDNPINDVEGSRAAGYVPVWVRTTGVWGFDEIKKPEYIVENVGEIPELLDKIENKGK